MMSTLKKMLIDHGPAILTGLGIAAMGSATVTAAKTAMVDGENGRTDIKIYWKHYILPAVEFVVGGGCVVAATHMNSKRMAALAGLYSLSETALQTYKDKVIEKIGEKQERQVRKESNEKEIRDNYKAPKSWSDDEFVNNDWCYDKICGRYFKSSVNQLEKAANDLNNMILLDNFASLNDFYYAADLESTTAGDMLGWRVEDGLVTLDLDTGKTPDGHPCIVVDFAERPHLNFC